LEKRLRMRPSGVASKKPTGARTVACHGEKAVISLTVWNPERKIRPATPTRSPCKYTKGMPGRGAARHLQHAVVQGGGRAQRAEVERKVTQKGRQRLRARAACQARLGGVPTSPPRDRTGPPRRP